MLAAPFVHLGIIQIIFGVLALFIPYINTPGWFGKIVSGLLIVSGTIFILVKLIWFAINYNEIKSASEEWRNK